MFQYSVNNNRNSLFSNKGMKRHHGPLKYHGGPLICYILPVHPQEYYVEYYGGGVIESRNVSGNMTQIPFFPKSSNMK